jgi:ribosomal protein S11
MAGFYKSKRSLQYAFVKVLRQFLARMRFLVVNKNILILFSGSNSKKRISNILKIFAKTLKIKIKKILIINKQSFNGCRSKKLRRL